MNIVFMIASEYGLKCFEEIERLNIANIVGIVTTKKEFVLHYGDNKKNMNNVIYEKLYKLYEIPIYEIEKMNSDETANVIIGWDPDLIVVSGWYHIIGRKILDIPQLGVVGLHASLLPKYKGGAPLVWQMINGEETAGITLFYFDEGVDSGDIIAQAETPIYYEDTIKSLYERIGDLGIGLLRDYIPKILEGAAPKIKQEYAGKENIYPQRSPQDGLIDWEKSPSEIRNFVRAQTKPYPGAFTYIGNKKVTIWDCDIEEIRIES